MYEWLLCQSRFCVCHTDLVFFILFQSFIYWAVWGQVPKIMRARLDGTERKELINKGITFPQALALDESNRRLFWAGTDETKSQGIIEWVSLDGLNRNVTFRSPGYCPYSLDIYEGFVYWADRRKKAILRISSRGGEEEMVITGLKKPVGVKFCQERTEFENNHGRTFKEIYILTID